MSTRCDFYVGRGAEAEYLGSVGHDAYVDAMAERFASAVDRASFDTCLRSVFKEYGEIPAAKGWPWPWKDSGTTDTVVAFDEGQVWTAHPDGCWALLSDFETPTETECVFPDMLSALEATPEGRLSQRLRYTADIVIGPRQDVLLQLLYHATSQLAALWLHVFEWEGDYWVLPALWERQMWDLRTLASALQAAGDDFDQLLAKRRAIASEAEWGLLQWLKDTGGCTDAEPATIAMTASTPFYFRQPLPAAELVTLTGPMGYLKLKRTADLREGRRLVEMMLDRGPYWFAYHVALAVSGFGALPVPRAQVDEWLEVPQAELGERSLEQTCETAQGRERVLEFAARLVFA